eukprot:tig00000545_g1990.t1
MAMKSTDERKLEALFAEFPDVDPGIVQDLFVAVDCDLDVARTSIRDMLGLPEPASAPSALLAEAQAALNAQDADRRMAEELQREEMRAARTARSHGPAHAPGQRGDLEGLYQKYKEILDFDSASEGEASSPRSRAKEGGGEDEEEEEDAGWRLPPKPAAAPAAAKPSAAPGEGRRQRRRNRRRAADAAGSGAAVEAGEEDVGDEELEKDLVDPGNLIYDWRVAGRNSNRYEPTVRSDDRSADNSTAFTKEIHASIKKTLRKQEANQRRTEKDRSTTEGVMDQGTRLLLLAAINDGRLSEVNGAVATGKEAAVFHATDPEGREVAVKVFKTRVLEWRDRDKYIADDYRFRHGYHKHNQRKMVIKWAEKEMRNLIRLYRAGVRCPEPLALRQHVLLMSFIGKAGWPAPRLKDVEFASQAEAGRAWRQCADLLRRLYFSANLVHGDFSEYNLLYGEGGLVWVIDLATGVDLEHPEASALLRADCAHTSEFFARAGLPCPAPDALFSIVTDATFDWATDARLPEALRPTQEEIEELLLQRVVPPEDEDEEEEEEEEDSEEDSEEEGKEGEGAIKEEDEGWVVVGAAEAAPAAASSSAEGASSAPAPAGEKDGMTARERREARRAQREAHRGERAARKAWRHAERRADAGEGAQAAFSRAEAADRAMAGMEPAAAL